MTSEAAAHGPPAPAADAEGRGKSEVHPAQPVGAGEFAAAMHALGPWEAAPQLCVAVSGGADSMALALLAHEWTKARQGRIKAITVDHGLRPESKAEAQLTAARLQAAGIRCRVLAWAGDKPRTGLQAAARLARYRLLTGWCARAGVLHLLVGHHASDQAETVVLRAAAGSGLHGLAAMAGVVETRKLRVLRPLLGVEAARLRATISARGGSWIEDPSNTDRRFTRIRLRQGLAATGGADSGFAAAARRIGLIRAFDERAVCALLARASALHPAGFAVVDPQVLRAAPPELAERALGRALASIGGRQHSPGRASLGRLRAAVAGPVQPRARTLAGCRIAGWRGRLLICREAGRGLPRIALTPGGEAQWDGRFFVQWPASGHDGIFVAALGAEGRGQICAGGSRVGAPIPTTALPSLPAFWDGQGLAAVPHLSYVRPAMGNTRVGCVIFQPNQPFVPPNFAVARAPSDPI